MTHNGVQQIREVVLVAHGSPLGLLVPLVEATGDPDLRTLNPLSLSDLQDKFQTGDSAFSGFAANRAEVLKHFSPNAFVTLRVCRFGQSDEGMYAVYSFFGGNVDVYAPLKYQFFGSVFLESGARFLDRLAYHDHLVRQRFVPAGRHTPARATALVRAMEHVQSFSDPFEVASMAVGGGEPPEYGAFIDTLNAAQLSPALKTSFEAHDFALSSSAKALVVEKDAAWRISDTVAQDQESFPVRYSIGEEVGADRRQLMAQGTVVGDGAEVSLQVFLDDFDDAELKGEVGLLAYKVDGDPADAPNVKRFDGLSSLLAGNGPSGSTFTAGDLDLRAEIAGYGDMFRPADNATITVAADDTLDSGLHVTVWLVAPTDAGPALEIRLKHPYTNQRIRAHTLTVVRHFIVDPDGVSRDRAGYEAGVLAWAGTNLDSPGVELAASLDRLSLDDLVELIAYLHSPYDPERVVQLHHAQEALQRKAEYRDWLAQRYPTGADIPFPTGDPVIELSLGQQDDLTERSYAFAFNENWREVRESVTPKPSFHDDLFLEESLLDRFPNVLDSWNGLEDEGEDSPSASARDAQPAKTSGQQRFSTTTVEKDTFTPPDVAVGCEEYRAAIKRIKELKDLPVGQLSVELGGQKTPGGKSYFDIAVDVASKYGTLVKLWNLTELKEILKLPSIPTDTYGFGKLALKWISKATEWELGSAVAEILSADMVITIPLKMYAKFLDALQEGVDKNEAFGRLTGVRAWLRALEDRATQAPHLIDDLTIDLTGYTDDQVMAAYTAEVGDDGSLRFNLFIEDFHRGFTEGAQLMQDRWPFFRDDVHQIVSKALQDASEDSCRTSVLIDEGVLDLDELRALVIRQTVDKLLGELPRV